jgi:hypothetical protein
MSMLIEQLKAVSKNNPRENEKSRKVVVDMVYALIENKIKQISITDFVFTNKEALSVIPRLKESPWKQRLYQHAKKINEIIVCNLMTWEHEQEELLVLQIDYQSFLLQKQGYRSSTPPRIYYKKNDHINKVNLSSWKYSNLGATIYTIHGFIGGDLGKCPDVLISAGPVGSGKFIYFVQMHFDVNSKKWKPIWQTGFAHVVDVNFSANNDGLDIIYLADKFSGITKKIHYSLKMGIDK